jgi:hypothetical protein
MAEQLFAQALPAVTGFTSPRAWAFSLIGIHEYLRRMKGDRLAEGCPRRTDRAVDDHLRPGRRARLDLV